MNKNLFSRKNLLTSKTSFLQCFIVLVMTLLSFGNLEAQCTALVCNDFVNVSVDQGCTATITPDMVLEGDYPDYTIFQVVITDQNGVDIGNTVGLDNIGQTLDFMVVCSDADGDNSCWGQLLVEDKLAPSITCPVQDIDLVCSDLDVIYTPDETVLADGVVLDTGNPIVDDNCAVVSVTYSDVLDDGGMCDADVITRTFTVTDIYGNTATCEQTITVRRPTIDEAIFPEPLVLNCTDVTDLLPQTLYEQGHDGLPTINSFYGLNVINETYCNLGASYHDAPIVDLCGGGYKVLRTWTVIDWCSSEARTDVQIIKVEDADGPAFDCPVYEDVSAVTNNGLCEATITILDILNYDDNCSDIGSVVVVLDGVEYAVGDVVTLSAGSYDFTYFVTDQCDNEATPCVATLNIIDTTPPVAICDEHTTVSLGSDGNATVCWQTFDDGSYDNCSDVVIKVKRMDAPNSVDFADCVDFDCSDVGDVVMIRMRVYDIVSADAFDDNDDDSRYNECMIEVLVEDKLAPQITCPADKTLDCHAFYGEVPEVSPTNNGGIRTFYNGQSIGWYDGGYDNCDATINITDAGDVDNCGEATIIRTWTITDDGDLSVACDQEITLFNDEPFTSADIEWPADAEVDCASGLGTDPGDLPPGENWPVITEDACDLVAVTYDDQVLTITEDACYKILRTWTVLDWCQFDETQPPYTEGFWQYTQIIKVFDAVAPIITSTCDDVTIGNFEVNCGPTYVELILTATDDNCAADSDLNFEYTIDAFNDGNPDGPAFSGMSSDVSGDFPIGTHHISWSVEDNCGNVSYCDYTFTVEDQKKPTPVLINGLATVIMPSSGQITLWATDFDGPNSGSFDNCDDDLDFYMRIVDAGSPVLTDLADIIALGSSAVFDCDNLGYANVEVYVVDNDGNWDFGNTYAAIQDPNSSCTGGMDFELAGAIYTEMDEMMSGVNVSISGNDIAMPSYTTDGSGNFLFSNINSGNYVITPEKDDNPTNGVTTYDLVLIGQHILGMNLLDSPYKLIAADANRSGSITTFDLVQIRRLILNIDVAFSSNTSWRFVDASFLFPDAANPFMTTFPEVAAINDLNSVIMNNDFVGVKIGDVNNSAVPNNFNAAQNRNFSESLKFNTKDQKLVAGQSCDVSFNANAFEAILGYQYTLRFDTETLDFVELKNGQLSGLTEANFGWAKLDEGIITSSWNNHKAISLKEGADVFTISFIAKKDGLLSEALNLNSSATQAEAYSDTQGDMGVELAFTNTVKAINDFALYQNSPNPFKSSTIVGFNMPQTGTATLTFYDVTGKVLSTIQNDFAKGYNSVEIEKTQLPASGLIYYELQTATDKAVKLMMVME